MIQTIRLNLGDGQLLVPTRTLLRACLDQLDEEQTAGIGVAMPGRFPRIGADWKEQGGIFVGIARGNPQHDNYLILGPEAPEPMPWDDGLKWAAGLNVNGYRDFSVHTKEEGPILYANAADQFRKEYYWTATQFADVSDYAWIQHFGDGYQIDYRKSVRCRVRAVRRVVIE